MRQSNDKYTLIMERNPHHPIAEEYRALRMMLELSVPENDRGTVAVVSAEAQEGRTTVAANLAIAFAHGGKRVLLVDADVRKPRVHELFRRPGRSGLANALAGPCDVGTFVRDTDIGGLHIFPAGPPPPNPAELLSGESMALLLEQLKSSYDIVIVDTPPAQHATDAGAISARCDGVLLVARAGKTKRSSVAQMRRAFKMIGANMLGVVLNRAVRTRKPDALRSFARLPGAAE